MTDIIPEQIKFIFIDQLGNVIPHLLVCYKLISKRKNNYSIGYLLSDEKGEIIFPIKIIENVISKNSIDFPMDYGGDLNDCTHLKVLIETREELKNRVITLNEFYPENASLLKQAIAKGSNGNTHIDKLFPLPIVKKEIVVKMEEWR